MGPQSKGDGAREAKKGGHLWFIPAVSDGSGRVLPTWIYGFVLVFVTSSALIQCCPNHRLYRALMREALKNRERVATLQKQEREANEAATRAHRRRLAYQLWDEQDAPC